MWLPFDAVRISWTLQKKVLELRAPNLRNGLRAVVSGFKEVGLVMGFLKAVTLVVFLRYFSITFNPDNSPPFCFAHGL